MKSALSLIFLVGHIAAGFVGTIPGFYLRGGTQIGSDLDEDGCREACLSQAEDCMAVDYDIEERTCTAHNNTSYCKRVMLPNPHRIHIRRLPCDHTPPTPFIPTKSPADPPDGFVNWFPKMKSVDEPDSIEATITDCLQMCRTDANCKAIDHKGDMCTLHNSTTGCSGLLSRLGYRHYRKSECGDQIPSDVESILDGFYVPGGIPLATGWNECLDVCGRMPSCHSFDFNTEDETCSYHTETTYCNGLHLALSYTHVEFKSCGFHTSVRGYGKLWDSAGMVLIGRDIDQAWCFRQCLKFRWCVAVDHHYKSGTCWGIEATALCYEPLVERPGYTHFSRIECPFGEKEFVNYHIPGGTLLSKNVTKQECLKLCEKRRLCQAINYERDQQICMSLPSASACKPLQFQRGLTHIKLHNCEGTQDRRITGFVGTNTGFYLEGGARIGSNLDESGCREACLSMPEHDCMAVDYDRKSKTCTAHSTNTYCKKNMTANKDRIHIRRVPCEHIPAKPFSMKKRPTPEGFVDWFPHTKGLGGSGDLRVSVTECLQLCRDNPACKAVDHQYKGAKGICQLLDSRKACTGLRHEPDYHHYRKEDCGGDFPDSA